MFEGFPYTNFHELNLDWIIKIAKDFLDQYTHIQETIDNGLTALDEKAVALQALLDAWYEEHSQDIADQLADALQDLNDWYTEHQGYLDQYLTDSITAFDTAADQKAALTIASIPDDYTALSKTASDLDNAYKIGTQRPLIVTRVSTGTLPALAEQNASAFKFMCIDFDSPDDEEEFWTGTHTYNNNTYTRNFSLSYIPTNDSIRFYWYDDENTNFIAGNSAFTFALADRLYQVDGYYYCEKHLALDEYNVTIRAIIDYSAIQTATGTYACRFTKEFNKVYRAIFDLNNYFSKYSPIKISGAVNISYSYTAVKAIKAFYLNFNSVTDEASFWSGTHTSGDDEYPRNVGPGALYKTNNGKRISFYWLNDENKYISGDRAFNVSEYTDIICVVNNVTYHRIQTVLDDFPCNVIIGVEWESIPVLLSETAVTTYYDKKLIDYNRALLSFLIGIESINSIIVPAQSSSQNIENAFAIRSAIKELFLEFNSNSAESEFWTGTHTYNDVSYPRNIGPALLRYDAEKGKGIGFYWVDEDNHYIAGNGIVTIWQNINVFSNKAGITFHNTPVTLDEYPCIIHLGINWDLVPTVEADAVFFAGYNKNTIESNKMLYVFSGGQSVYENNSTVNFGVDGDSISAGNQWSAYVTNKLGYNTHHNVSVGSSQWHDEVVTYNGVDYYPQVYGSEGWLGMSAGYGEITSAEEAQKRANNSAKNHVLKFIDEVDQGLYPAPDLFVFALGTNDGVTHLGTVADAFASESLPAVTDTILRTTTGAMRWCIQKMKITYPACKIYWATPIQSTVDARQNGNITKIPVMTEVANKLSVMIIDQWNNSGISGFLEKSNSYYLRDGIHPNAHGVEAMGQYAVSVLAGFSGTF